MLWAALLKHLNTAVSDSLVIQNQLLKAQVRELQRQLPSQKRLVLSLFCKQEMARLGKQLTPEGLKDAAMIVKPSTVLRWYRTLVAAKFDGSTNRSYPGRPRIKPENEQLILEIASHNTSWGAKRIEGALAHIGITISHQTILDVLKRNGVHPSPIRRTEKTWAQFIAMHRDVTIATDFFSQEVLGLRGLTTYYILFFIDIASREVYIAGMTNHPNEAWMQQIARNITMADEPFFNGKQYVIHDRDSKYCASFRNTLRCAGIKPIKLPVLSPNLNAYAERWIRSIKTECLNHLILIGKGSLEKALKQYLAHYNQERTHQGLNNSVLGKDTKIIHPQAQIKARSRLGGLLNYYYRE